VLEKGHQRRQLVGRSAQAGFEERHQTLPKQKRVEGFTLHGRPSMSPPRSITALPHCCEGEGRRGQTRSDKIPDIIRQSVAHRA
jgi:hypothetical protein